MKVLSLSSVHSLQSSFRSSCFSRASLARIAREFRAISHRILDAELRKLEAEAGAHYTPQHSAINALSARVCHFRRACSLADWRIVEQRRIFDTLDNIHSA